MGKGELNPMRLRLSSLATLKRTMAAKEHVQAQYCSLTPNSGTPRTHSHRFFFSGIKTERYYMKGSTGASWREGERQTTRPYLM